MCTKMVSLLLILLLCLQTSRQDSCPGGGSGSQELLEETLRGSAPYPMIVLPPGGGYWVDGHEHPPTATPLAAPAHSWRAKFETDDTAKCYRRFFLGRVSPVTLCYGAFLFSYISE